MKRTIDGDTVEFYVDLGFDTLRVEKIRFLGVDTPERGEDGYKKAKFFVQDALSTCENVIIETSKDHVGKFGRYLATIYYDGKNLNQELLNKGMAKPFMV